MQLNIKVEDPLDSINTPALVTIMKEIRAIRGICIQSSSEKTDKELFADTLSMKIKETDKI